MTKDGEGQEEDGGARTHGRVGCGPRCGGGGRSSSRKQKTPGYITVDLCDFLEVFCLSTASFRRLYKETSSLVKSQKDSLNRQVSNVRGAWRNVYGEQVATSMSNPVNVQSRCGVNVAPGRAARNAHVLAGLTLHLLSEQVLRDVGRYVQWSGSFAPMSSEDADIAARQRAKSLRE